MSLTQASRTRTHMLAELLGNMKHDTKGFKVLSPRSCPYLAIPVVLLMAGSILLNVAQYVQTAHTRTGIPSINKQNFQSALPFETITSREVSQRHLEKDPRYGRKLNGLLKILVTDYRAWHRKQRELCDKDPSHAHSLPLLVFRGSKVNYGLGDQIRALLYTYLAAVVTKRFFLIDLRQPFPISDMLTNPPAHNFTYDPYLFLGKGEEEAEIPGERGYPDISMYFNPARVLIERSQPSFWVIKFYRIPVHYPYLQYSQQIKKAGLLWFKPGQSVLAPFLLQGILASSPALRKLLAERNPFTREEYLASHARFGVGVGERQSRFNLESEGLTLRTASICFGRAVALAAKEWSLDKIFFATDTEITTKWVEEGIHHVLPNATVATTDGRAVHLSHMGDGRERKSYEAFENAFVDLGLLSQAKRLVALRSGFARLAGWNGVFHDDDTIQVNWGLCPLLGVGTKKVARNCGGADDRISMRTLLDESIKHTWEVSACG